MFSLETEIARTFRFSPDDLVANRQGQLSEAQITKLHRIIQRKLMPFAPLYLVALAIVLLSIYRLLEAKYEIPLALPIVFGLIVLIAPVYVFLRHWQISTNELRVIEGIAIGSEKVVAAETSGFFQNIRQSAQGFSFGLQAKRKADASRYLEIANQQTGESLKFPVTNLSSALKMKEQWRVYYHPKTKSLLSIEPV